MLSLRNFYVNMITFWSSRGNLSSKKSKKTEENAKFQKRVTISQKRDTIPQGIMHAIDIEENVSRWQKRDTIWWNPNSVSCYTRWKCVTIYLKRDTILGEFLCLFKLKTIQKTRVTIWEEKCAILRPKDG